MSRPPYSSYSTPEQEPPISQTDIEFILLIIQGYASSYSIWSYMKDNPKEYPKPTAYKNINQRLIRLARIGLLKGEVKFDTPASTHGRRDYNVTMKGLERLIPYILTQPKKMGSIVQYIDKFGLSKEHFWDLLFRKIYAAVNAINEFAKYAKLPGIGKYVSSFDNILYISKEKMTPDIIIRTDAKDFFDKTDKIKQSIEALNDVTKQMNTRQKTNKIVKLTEELISDLHNSIIQPHSAEPFIEELAKIEKESPKTSESAKTSEVLDQITKDIAETSLSKGLFPGEMTTEGPLPRKNKKH